MKATKSLRFKLTLGYSLLVLLFCLLFLLGMNLVISKYTRDIERDVREDVEIMNPGMINPMQNFANRLNEEEKELFLETRYIDVKNIRNISFYVLIPLTLLSFLGGYLFPDKFLIQFKILKNKWKIFLKKS